MLMLSKLSRSFREDVELGMLYVRPWVREL